MKLTRSNIIALVLILAGILRIARGSDTQSRVLASVLILLGIATFLRVVVSMKKQKKRCLALESPKLDIPWGCSFGEALKFFEGRASGLIRETAFSVKDIVWRDLHCTGFFSFESPSHDGLHQVELVIPGFKYDFEGNQKKLEQQFGKPNLVGQYRDPHFEWHFGSVKLIHCVTDRFGPEEHIKLEPHDEQL